MLVFAEYSKLGLHNPRLTLLHLADEFLVEQAPGLLVERAVDGNNVRLRKQLLKSVNTTAANFLLGLGGQRLVVVVQKLLAVEWLETAQNTLTDTADSNSTDNLVLQVELVLGGSGNIPLTTLDLLVGGDEVAHQGQDGHDDVLSDGDDVGTSDLSNGNTAIGLVGSVQVNMVGTNTGRDSELEVLGLGETLGSQVSGVETIEL